MFGGFFGSGYDHLGASLESVSIVPCRSFSRRASLSPFCRFTPHSPHPHGSRSFLSSSYYGGSRRSEPDYMDVKKAHFRYAAALLAQYSRVLAG